jgi:hypothetical protein
VNPENEVMIFRSLSPKQIEDFRQYARESDPPDMSMWPFYHPICREVWEERGIRPEKVKMVGNRKD